MFLDTILQREHTMHHILTPGIGIIDIRAALYPPGPAAAEKDQDQQDIEHWIFTHTTHKTQHPEYTVLRIFPPSVAYELEQAASIAADFLNQVESRYKNPVCFLLGKTAKLQAIYLMAEPKLKERWQMRFYNRLHMSSFLIAHRQDGPLHFDECGKL